MLTDGHRDSLGVYQPCCKAWNVRLVFQIDLSLSILDCLALGTNDYDR